LKAAAKKSLDPGHWTKEILNAESKFASKVEENLEEKLSQASVSEISMWVRLLLLIRHPCWLQVGLVTYEAMKAKREALEAAQEESKNATEEQKRKAEEDARRERDLKKAKGEKVKSKLSFNPDADGDE
jgi:hypothetical protein